MVSQERAASRSSQLKAESWMLIRETSSVWDRMWPPFAQAAGRRSVGARLPEELAIKPSRKFGQEYASVQGRTMAQKSILLAVPDLQALVDITEALGAGWDTTSVSSEADAF